MSDNLPWFRFYPEALNDRKISRVCLITRQPKAMVIGVWVTLLSLASDSPERGSLLIAEDIPITIDEILAECGIDDPAIINAFIDLGMIYVEDETFHVTNWNGRQFASDDSTARVRKHRAKKKAEPQSESSILPPKSDENEPKLVENGTNPPIETLPEHKHDDYKKQQCNVSVTPPESDTESDTDTDSSPNGEGEGDKSPPNSKIPNESFAMFKALTDLCQIDIQLIGKGEKDGWFKAAKTMRDNGYMPTDVEEFGVWWYANDWRGKQDQPPTQKQVKSVWGQFLRARNGKRDANETNNRNLDRLRAELAADIARMERDRVAAGGTHRAPPV